jgi:hypothetical protein
VAVADMLNCVIRHGRECTQDRTEKESREREITLDNASSAISE